MSPEQIRGAEVDGRADQFSLAVLAYQLLTGRLPFQGDSWISLSYKILNQPPDSPEELVQKAGDGAASAILKALSKTPADRFPTCGEFAAALAGTAPPATRPRSRTALLAGLSLAAVAIAALAWFATSRRRAPSGPPPTPRASVPKESMKPPAVDPGSLVAERASVIFEFVSIPAGQFMMGSDIDNLDERPRHLVRITKAFQMGKHEVTRRQWATIMGQPVPASGDDLPALGVSFDSAQRFLANMNAASDGFRYRLPTEAEWEYALRAGTEEDVLRRLDDIAWYAGNSNFKPQPVAQRLPNAWGLHDLIGNAWEWTGDWYDEEYYGKSTNADPAGPSSGQLRVIRGGSYHTQPMMLRPTFRAARKPSDPWEEAGLRLVRQPAR